MQRTILIEPINKAIRLQTLSLGFWDGGIFKTLSPDFKIVEHKVNLNDPKTIPTTTVLKFSHMKMSEMIQYEDDEKKQTAYDKDKMKAINLFYGKHTMVMRGESPSDPLWNHNVKEPQFKIVDITEKALEEIISFEDRLNITNKVSGMSLKQKRDVCFYFGQNPKGKSEQEIVLFLCEPNNGYLFTKTANENRIEEFKNAFMQDDPEREFYTNIQKAILLGVIENRADGGKNNYYIGATPIGQSTTDVVMYLKKEADLYNKHILGQVAEKDVVSDELKKSVLQANGLASAKTTTTAVEQKEKDELKERAKQLKSEGYIDKTFAWHVVGLDKLRAEVSAAEVRKEQGIKIEIGGVEVKVE